MGFQPSSAHATRIRGIRLMAPKAETQNAAGGDVKKSWSGLKKRGSEVWFSYKKRKTTTNMAGFISNHFPLPCFGGLRPRHQQQADGHHDGEPKEQPGVLATGSIRSLLDLPAAFGFQNIPAFEVPGNIWGTRRSQQELKLEVPRVLGRQTSQEEWIAVPRLKGDMPAARRSRSPGRRGPTITNIELPQVIFSFFFFFVFFFSSSSFFCFFLCAVCLLCWFLFCVFCLIWSFLFSVLALPPLVLSIQTLVLQDQNWAIERDTQETDESSKREP